MYAVKLISQKIFKNQQWYLYAVWMQGTNSAHNGNVLQSVSWIHFKNSSKLSVIKWLGYWLEDRGNMVRISAGPRCFIFTQASDRSGCYPVPHSAGTVVVSLLTTSIKRPKHETDQSPSFSIEVKNDWNLHWSVRIYVVQGGNTVNGNEVSTWNSLVMSEKLLKNPDFML